MISPYPVSEPSAGPPPAPLDAAMNWLETSTLRAIVRLFASRDLRIRLRGRENLPRNGPALLVCRHFHHFYDGLALLDVLPRLPRLFVALDWIRDPFVRFFVEGFCALFEWPAALRGENLSDDRAMAFSKSEVPSYVRRSVRFAARLLERGEVLAVFPEGYPTIDPVYARKPDSDAYLPFRPGFLGIAAQAQRDRVSRVPLIPTGLRYLRRHAGWDVDVRLGEPQYLERRSNRGQLIEQLSKSVRELSS